MSATTDSSAGFTSTQLSLLLGAFNGLPGDVGDAEGGGGGLPGGIVGVSWGGWPGKGIPAARDTWLSNKAVIDAAVAQAQSEFTADATGYNPVPTQVMSDASPPILNLLTQFEAPWQDTRGRVTLGQILVSIVEYEYLLHFWLGTLIFGVAQWAQFRVQDILARLNGDEAALARHESTLSVLSQEVNTLNAEVADLPSIRATVAAHSASLATLLNSTIPFIYANLRNLWNAANFIEQQQFPAFQAQLNALSQFVKGAIGPQLQGAQAAIASLTGQMQTVVFPVLRSLQQAVGGVQQQLATVIVPALDRHTADLLSIHRQIDTVLGPEIGALFAGLQSTDNTITQFVMPALVQDAANILSDTLEIKSVLEPQLAQGLRQLNDLQTLEIPAIAQRLQQQQQELQDVSQPLPVQQKLRAIQANQAQDEQIIAQSLIPAIQALQQAAGNLQQQIAQGLQPQINALLSLTAHFSALFATIVLPQLTVIFSWIANIGVVVQNIVIEMVPVIYVLIRQYRQQNPQTGCDEGRTWWGVWTECWLDANTPPPMHFWPAYPVPQSPQDVLGAVEAALAEVPGGPYAPAIAIAQQAFAVGEQGAWQVLAPPFTWHARGYIFANVSGL